MSISFLITFLRENGAKFYDNKNLKMELQIENA